MKGRGRSIKRAHVVSRPYFNTELIKELTDANEKKDKLLWDIKELLCGKEIRSLKAKIVYRDREIKKLKGGR